MIQDQHHWQLLHKIFRILQKSSDIRTHTSLPWLRQTIRTYNGCLKLCNRMCLRTKRTLHYVTNIEPKWKKLFYDRKRTTSRSFGMSQFQTTPLPKTPHDKPLQWLFSVKKPNSRLLRWRLELEQYYNTKGSNNIVADALSLIEANFNELKN